MLFFVIAVSQNRMHGHGLQRSLQVCSKYDCHSSSTLDSTAGDKQYHLGNAQRLPRCMCYGASPQCLQHPKGRHIGYAPQVTPLLTRKLTSFKAPFSRLLVLRIV
jgi:hypothetical protein